MLLVHESVLVNGAWMMAPGGGPGGGAGASAPASSGSVPDEDDDEDEDEDEDVPPVLPDEEDPASTSSSALFGLRGFAPLESAGSRSSTTSASAPVNAVHPTAQAAAIVPQKSARTSDNNPTAQA